MTSDFKDRDAAGGVLPRHSPHAAARLRVIVGVSVYGEGPVLTPRFESDVEVIGSVERQAGDREIHASERLLLSKDG